MVTVSGWGGQEQKASVHYTVHNQPNQHAHATRMQHDACVRGGQPHNQIELSSDSCTTHTIVSVVTATGITPGTHPEPGS